MPRVPALVCSVALTACRAVLGLDELPGYETVGSTGGALATGGSGAGTGGDALIGGGGAGGTGTGGSPEARDRQWAQWPIPTDLPAVEDYVIQEGTVRDTVTGLLWTQTPGPSDTLANATKYCDDLSLAEETDWLVPTRIELSTLVDFSDVHPIFHPEVFASTSDATCVWTATPVLAGGSGNVWAFFTAGKTPVSVYTEGPCATLCVHLEYTHVESAAPSYVFGTGTAKDPSTGLLWEQLPPAVADEFETAAGRCAHLAMGEHSTGWRLPTIKELESLVDVRGSDLLLPDVLGDLTEQWASTNTSEGQWSLYFGSGEWLWLTGSTATRCVWAP